MVGDVYAVTGTTGGRRSHRHSHERFSELSDSSRYYRFSRMFDPVGYNWEVGFPRDIPDTLVCFECEGLGMVASTR